MLPSGTSRRTSRVVANEPPEVGRHDKKDTIRVLMVDTE
jgi:hypothetical protein